jgi:hypothetical protein
MNKYLLLILHLCFCTANFSLMADTIPAFPGAEGHGRFTTGGRGGLVYHVTSLEDDPVNPKFGTLRYFLNKTEKRTIVFDVSGTIFLKDALNINAGNLTIAGQTAPGDGICLAGYPVHVNSSNIIIRFLRFRMGDLDPNNEDDALGGRGIKNIVIDHCSCSWSVDECVSFYGNENLTLQWCIISESLRHSNHEKGNHGYGGIWGGANTSFHHNLLAHHSSRTPRLGAADNTDGRDNVDLRNNVIYNYGLVVGCYGAEGMDANIINCYYKPGPSTKTNHNRRSMIIGIGANTTDSARPKWGKYYIAGNWCSSLSDTYKLPTDSYERNTCLDNWNYGVYNNISEPISAQEKAAMRLSEPNNPGLVTTHTAQVAFEKVLGTAGCSLQRDEIDLRIVDETRRGTATFKGSYTAVGGIIDSQNDLKPAGAGSDWSPWPTLNSTEPPKDTDQDGMPDAWEEARGLNPRYPLDRNDIAENGYTNLENYLNSLVEEIVRQELSDYEFVTGSGQNDLPAAINPPMVAKQKKENNKVWYDLSGRPIESPNARGLYIRRGEKLVIR